MSIVWGDFTKQLIGPQTASTFAIIGKEFSWSDRRSVFLISVESGEKKRVDVSPKRTWRYVSCFSPDGQTIVLLPEFPWNT